MAGGFFNTMSPFFEGGAGDVMAQSGQKFATGLNNLGGTDALGSSNNFPLVIKTNSTEWLRITPTGNVGIGLTNPTDKLHVAGTARMLNAMVDNQLQSLSVIAQTADFTTAVVTGNFSAGSLTVSGNVTVNGNLSALGGLTTGNITSPSGNISLGNNNLSTTGNISSANISALQASDSILNSQFSILNSQVDSIQSSQWTTTQNGIEHNGNVFVKNLSVEESINIGSFRFSNGSKDTAIAPPPVIKDTIASDKPLVISAEKNISLNADTVLLGNGTGKVGIGIPPAPGEKLSVAGNVGVSGNLRLQSLSGTDERLLYVDSSGNLKVNPLTAGDAWVTDGNEISNGDFIGTTNSNDLVIKTNNLERMHITATGKVGIGTSNPQEKLDVNGNAVFSNKVYINTTPGNILGTHYELNVCGTIQSQEWIVQTGWCDFALKPGYKKMNWRDKRNFYLLNGYLPYMDSGAEIEKNGLHSRNLKGMMWNIEENRLDIDELSEKMEQLEKENKAKDARIELLEKRIEALEKKLSDK